jgi:tRNA threonylcarbamoyladenosine biosynthesis protein TsaB
MNVLVLSTSGPQASVGLRTADGRLRARPLGQGADRGRGVAPAIAEVLAEAGLSPADVGGVAVDVGPGSFTGTRVGVATAKGLHVATGVPLVGVASLDAIAHATGPAPAPVLALRDARGGEAYFAVYEPAAEGPPPTAPRRLLDPTRGRADAIREAVAGLGLRKVIASGEDAERLAVSLGLGPILLGVRTPFVAAADVLAVALPRLLAGDADVGDALRPLYLQPSTPERRLAEAGPPPGGSAP